MHPRGVEDLEDNYVAYDPRNKVWCREHTTWREKCRKVHEHFDKELARMRELFKDVG